MFKDFLTKLKSRQTLAVEAVIVMFAFLGSVYGGTRLGANVDHSTTSIHGGHTLVVPGDSLGGFMSGADKTKLDGLGTTMKGYVDAWSTSNIGLLSGLANTVDGVAVNTANMVVCSAAQTTTTQDGCYLSASGSWTRLTQFAAGSAAHGATFTVISGTSNKGVWVFTNASGSDVVGTADLTAINVAAGGGGLTNPLTANLDFASLYQPINMIDPTSAQQGATKAYADRLDTAVDAVASGNIASLSGLATTVDGVALNSDGMNVLAVAQSTATQDACYKVHSGAWTLCDRMPSGATGDGRVFWNIKGTVNTGTWIVGAADGNPAHTIVGTNDLVATNTVTKSIIGSYDNLIVYAQSLGLTVLAGWQSDKSVTVATGASQWNDLSGNSNNFVQASGSFQPTVTATDATLNNLQTISCASASSQNMVAASLDLPAPPLTIYAVFRQTAWTAGHELWATTTGDSYALSPNTSTPSLVMFNGTAVNLSSGATLNTWVRAVAIFSNSTADSLKLGSAAAVTGANAGATNPVASFNLCKNSTSTFADVKIALLMFISGSLSGANQTALDAAVATKYGGVVVE